MVIGDWVWVEHGHSERLIDYCMITDCRPDGTFVVAIQGTSYRVSKHQISVEKPQVRLV